MWSQLSSALKIIPLFLLSAVLLNIQTGCHSEVPVDPLIPSSFVDPDEQNIEQYRLIFKDRVEQNASVLPLFAERSRSQKVLDFLDLKADDVLGDIGVGTAALELAILEKNLPFKKIYLIDVDKIVLDFVEFELKHLPQKSSSLQIVHSSFDNIKIPKNTLTKALLLNTPFYISKTDSTRHKSTSVNKCLQSIVDALVPGGRLIIVERHLNEDESINVQPNPTELCQPLIAPFSELGLTAEKVTSLKLDENNPHCAIILKKSSD